MPPSSVSTASTVTQGPVALPLFKFSHCTSPNPHAKTIWTHLPQRSDMFVVFDTIRKVGTGMVISEIKILKFVRGGELLEQVEFPDLQAQVKIDEERALSQHVPENLLNVLVIVKRPLLALRYTLPDGQIRKMQMNFSPPSGCETALETFRVAGLPIVDRDLPQEPPRSQPYSQERPGSLNAPRVASQRSQSTFPGSSQPLSQERPGSLNAPWVASRRSSQSSFPGSSQRLAQNSTSARNTGYGSIPFPVHPAQVDIRPTSAPGGLRQDEFSKPIPTSSGSTLNAFGSTITVTSVPIVAKPRIHSGLLPSPIFNGTYAPFGSSSQIRPLSAPEPTQTQQDYNNTPSPSQLLPPKWDRPFPEKEIHKFSRNESASQNEPVQAEAVVAKTKARRQTKPRAQSVKHRKSSAKVDNLPTNRKAPSSREYPRAYATSKAPSPNASSKLSLQSQNLSPLSELPASPNIDSRKRSLTDHSADQSNKRLAQDRIEIVTDTRTETLAAPAVAKPPPQAWPSQGTLPPLEGRGHDLLKEIDAVMGKIHDVDNVMRKYHGLDLPKVSSQSSKEHLAEQAAQGEDGDNLKALENLIRKCSKDSYFEEMMDAMEQGWKRFGLELEERRAGEHER